MQNMLRERAKTGVFDTHVLHDNHHLNAQIKRQREPSVKVTWVKRSSLNRIETVRSVTRSDNKIINRNKKLSNESILRDMKTRPVPFDQYTPTTSSSQSLVRSSILETNQITSFHKNRRSDRRSSIPNYEIYNPISLVSSFNKSFGSIDLLKSKSNLENQGKQSEQNTRGDIHSIFDNKSKRPGYNLEENVKKKKKERYRICRIYALCPNCCFASTIGALLFLVGIAALITFLLTNNHTTTTTSFTTPTTATTTSTTSVTSTSTSTATTTTSTTSTTTTSTSSATSTTSDTTTTTTPTPPCTPNPVGSNSTLYSAAPTTSSSYQCQTVEWTSPTTGIVTLAFQFRNVPGVWYLDDVSVYDGGTQMLTNGGFETGSLSPWIRTVPNGNCGGTAGSVTNTSPHSGNYSLVDGSFSCADEISQQFNAIAGDIYVVSFWLESIGAGAGQTVLVTLS